GDEVIIDMSSRRTKQLAALLAPRPRSQRGRAARPGGAGVAQDGGDLRPPQRADAVSRPGRSSRSDSFRGVHLPPGGRPGPDREKAAHRKGEFLPPSRTPASLITRAWSKSLSPSPGPRSAISRNALGSAR